jgi:hypothetical protein
MFAENSTTNVPGRSRGFALEMETTQNFGKMEHLKNRPLPGGA